MILVTGARAHFGRQAVEALVAAGQPVRALTRTPEAGGLPEGAEAVRGDLADEGSLRGALEGVSGLLLVLPYGTDPGPVLRAAGAAGVRRIAFLSSGAVVDGAGEQPDVIAAYHHRVERAVAAAGAEWTFLRIFFPAVNALPFAMQVKQGDVIRAPYGRAASAPVHERDVAEVAARVLVDGGHGGKVYEVTGPRSLTTAEQVGVLGAALGRELRFEEIEDGPVREQLGAFMDRAFIDALFDLMAATVGKPAAVTGVVEEITGRPPRSFERWAADHRDDFS